MLLNLVAKSLLKAAKSLESTIEGLVAASSATLELCEIFGIVGIRKANGLGLSFIPSICNDSLALRDLLL